MATLTLCLPADLEQAVAHEAALAGLAPADLVLQAVIEYCQRVDRERVLREYVEEAARGYSDPALRRDAVADVEEALDIGNEAMRRGGVFEPGRDSRAWWR